VKSGGTRGQATGVLFLVLFVATGCSRWEGQFPFVSSDTATIGTKMLRRGMMFTSCAFHVLGDRTPSSPVEDALDRLWGSDPEANGLVNLRIEVAEVSLGVISRSCATVVADVVRATSLALVPAPENQHHNHP